MSGSASRRGRFRYDASAKRAQRHGTEAADPRPRRSEIITPSDVARTRDRSGPVKTWAEMTPEERGKVLASLKGK